MTIEMNLQKGLVGHWTMNSIDIDNGVLRDKSGLENNGTLGDVGVNFPAPSGDSIKMKGIDNTGIDVSYNTTSQSELSIFVSFRIDGSSNNDFPRLFGGSIETWVYGEGNETKARVRLNSSKDTSGNQVVVGNVIPEGSFETFAQVYDGDSSPSLKVYNNGVRTGSNDEYFGDIDLAGFSAIGNSDVPGSRAFEGVIDEVRVYNRVLTDKEVSNLHNIRSDRSYGSPFNPPPRGLSPVNPISSMSHVDNNEYNGFKEMFCDFGRNLDSPIPVDVLFGETGGPYITVSFDIQQAGIRSLNNTVGLIHENDFGGYDKSGDSIDIGLGLGSRSNNNLFHPDDRLPSGPNAGIAARNDFRANSDINYYNHATSDTLTTSQESALRKFAKKLSPSTPHAASTVDTDSGQTRDYDAAVNSGFSSVRISSGHYVWLESNNKYLGATPIVEADSNNVGFNTWTESTHNAVVSSSPLGNSPPEGVGISDVSSEILIPEKYYGDVQTGGGTAFGTPYSKQLSIGDNFRNSRTFFLVRD